VTTVVYRGGRGGGGLTDDGRRCGETIGGRSQRRWLTRKEDEGAPKRRSDTHRVEEEGMRGHMLSP
jgi:hypothetical protein